MACEMWQEKLLMVCYELMLLALNAGDWNGFDRLQNDAKRLDRDIQRGKIEARKNDGHTATHGEDGKFTGSTPYADKGGGGGGGGSGRNNPFKRPKSGSGKEKSTDVPSWAKGNRPYQNENGNQFAKRLCDEHFGEGNYDKGPRSDYNRIRKWGDRGFE